MAEYRSDVEIVTEFLLRTCGSHPWLNYDDVLTLDHCAMIATARGSSDDGETEHIATKTGSVAELYIQPMLSCVGDIMCHLSTELAIPAGTAPPTQLPDEFHSRVKVFEIVDSEFPRYVYLVSCCLLRECIYDGKYSAVECERRYRVTVQRIRWTSPIHIFHKSVWDVWLGGVTLETWYSACVVCRGRHKPLIGQHDKETTAGQTQQPFVVLSTLDVMWLMWHIVGVDKINGCVTHGVDCHSHEQKLYC